MALTESQRRSCRRGTTTSSTSASPNTRARWSPPPRPRPTPMRLPRWTVPALVALRGTDGRRYASRARLVRASAAGVPFAKTNVVSTGTVGLPTSAEDLIGPSPSPSPSEPARGSDGSPAVRLTDRAR